jgi:hypothetical protein
MMDKCCYCGALHEVQMCPKIKSIEYFENGSVKRVEFKTAADFGPQATIPTVWPWTPQVSYTSGARTSN